MKRKPASRPYDEIIFGGKKTNPYIGFASRNFYATFLAALHVESHANIYFGEPFLQRKPVAVRNSYVDDEVKLKQILAKQNLSAKEFAALNPHIKSKYLKLDSILPKGTLITIPEPAQKANQIANQNELATEASDD